MENSELILTLWTISQTVGFLRRVCGGYIWSGGGADTMSERKTATNEELSRYLDELPDLLNGEAGGPGLPCVYPREVTRFQKMP